MKTVPSGETFIEYYKMLSDIHTMVWQKWKTGLYSKQEINNCSWRIKMKNQNYTLKLELDDTIEKGGK